MFTLSFRSTIKGDKKAVRTESISDVYGRNRITAKLGEMFTDFISLMGEIGKSGHPYFQYAENHSEEYTEQADFFVKLKGYIDLGISNPAFFTRECFVYFLNINGLSLPSMHYELIRRKGHENDAVENYIERDPSMPPLELAMRGFVKAGSQVYDDYQTVYSCEMIEDACVASLHYLLFHDFRILKCQNCGKYFVPLRSDALYCDRISPLNNKSTCKAHGAQIKHRKQKKKEDILTKATRINATWSQRARRNTDDEDLQKEYCQWSEQYRQKRRDYKSGALTQKQFDNWLERTKDYKKDPI